MIVLKFGGTSVADAHRMEEAAKIVAAAHTRSPVAVVVSAMGDTTNRLLEAVRLAGRGDGAGVRASLEFIERRHRAVAADPDTSRVLAEVLAELTSVLEGVRLLGEETPRSRALIASVGERLSAPILASHLRRAGLAAEAVDSRKFVVTDDQYEGAVVDLARSREKARALVLPLVDRGVLPVITGFIGATPQGITTTLGRGGSDYSASLVGAFLDAEEIQIWTDVDGILTADPRLVKEARILPQVSYREAAEMAFFGAKVLHPKTLAPAERQGIPVRIKNTFAPHAPGTLITGSAPTLPLGVKTVTSMHGLALVTVEGRGMAGVPGMARRVFEAAETASVSVILIAQASSEQSISIIVREAESARLVQSLKERLAGEIAARAIDQVVVEKDIAIASIVGQGMKGQPGISGRLFGALGAGRVNVMAIAQGGSELTVSVAVKEQDARRAVRAIHSAFGLTRLVNLMVLGPGRVGRAFLRQVALTREPLAEKLGIELRLIGLASSSRLVIDYDGIEPASAPDRLSSGEAPPTPDALIMRLIEGRFSDIILVDLTAADTAAYHRAALEGGIHVVTANKRPLSDALTTYERLFAASRATGSRLLYETTFGAGLPVLHTLEDLVLTGDRIQGIEGVLSGTLGHLATRIEEGVPLATALAEAREAGMTEPDPREDLSGHDVARKALIIARAIGLRLEPGDVRLEPFIPDLDGSLEAALARHSESLARRVAEEAARGRVLRYVAHIAPDGVSVGLDAVPARDPIGAVRGHDNILVYRTERYSKLPLTIRGPGAGAEVTAAGVLGDVLKAARR